jgi:DNA-binding response OmpR family regulator
MVAISCKAVAPTIERPNFQENVRINSLTLDACESNIKGLKSKMTPDAAVALKTRVFVVWKFWFSNRIHLDSCCGDHTETQGEGKMMEYPSTIYNYHSIRPVPVAVSREAGARLRLADRPTHVLVVDDDVAIRKLLTMTLRQDGYAVFAAASGHEALTYFATHPVDLVLLDINMPQMDGHAVCAELRQQSLVPIIYVTAYSRTDDLIRGLELGADNYITKPFIIQEVRARIHAVLDRVNREAYHRPAGQITIGEISLNQEQLEVSVRGQSANLTPNEFRLLRYMMEHPDQLITKGEFQSVVWGYQASGDINFIRVTVRRLRMKIEEDPSNPRYLKTVHGVGYQFCSQPTSNRPTGT